MAVIHSMVDNISSMLQNIRTQRQLPRLTILPATCYDARTTTTITLSENTRLFEFVKRKKNKYEHIHTGLPGTG